MGGTFQDSIILALHNIDIWAQDNAGIVSNNIKIIQFDFCKQINCNVLPMNVFVLSSRPNL